MVSEVPGPLRCKAEGHQHFGSNALASSAWIAFQFPWGLNLKNPNVETLVSFYLHSPISFHLGGSRDLRRCGGHGNLGISSLDSQL